MTLQRIFVSAAVDNKLRYLVGRTGLTANVLCRIGFCLSLREPGIPDLTLYETNEEGSRREFHHFTLLGPREIFFLALLRERMVEDELAPASEAELECQFRAHLSRGVMLVASRIKQLEDIADLLAEIQARWRAHLDLSSLPDEYKDLFP